MRPPLEGCKRCMSVKVWISGSLRGATNFIVVSSLQGKLRVSGRPERIGGPLYIISLMISKMIQILLRNFCPGTYLFRLPCTHYVSDHGGTADIPTLDDFLCQETTHWSGLGVIDILAATLDMTADQRRELRRWYERHMAYFRVVSLREPFMEVI